MTRQLESVQEAPPSPPATGPVPGLLVCALATAVAMAVNWWLPMVSPLLIAIVLGAILTNVAPLGPRYAPGMAIASRPLLRIGIALLGLQLVFGDILGLGAGVIAVIVCVVVFGIGGILWVGAKLGLSPAQRLLIACGTSICGAAAVAAVDGVIDADDEDVATAIGTVVVFGTMLLGLLPLAVHFLSLGPEIGGIWVGASVHEVAQVVAAGGMIGSGALAVAVVVKLGRVLMLAPVMTVISLRQRRHAPAVKRPPLVPVFVLGFLACVTLRSVGMVPDGVLQVAGYVQVALLSAAMFALGTGVRISALRAVGPRPFVLGAIGTTWVVGLGLAGALLVG